MQSNRRFIEDIQRPHEFAPQLARQSDTLGFATRKSIGPTTQGEIIQSDIEQKLKPTPYFSQNDRSNLPLSFGKLQTIDKVLGLFDHHLGNLDDIFATNQDMEGFLAQSRPVTNFTRIFSKKMLGPETVTGFAGAVG